MEQEDIVEMTEEQLQDKVAEGNRAVIAANQATATEWIQNNKGRGVLLAMDEDGTIRTLIVGNADEFTKDNGAVDSNLFNMLMMLLASHLPGSSMTMHAMAYELTERMNALLKNQQTMVSYLEMLNPKLQVQTQTLGGQVAGKLHIKGVTG